MGCVEKIWSERQKNDHKGKKHCHGRNITAPSFISIEVEIKLTLNHLYLINHLSLRDEPNTTGLPFSFRNYSPSVSLCFALPKLRAVSEIFTLRM